MDYLELNIILVALYIVLRWGVECELDGVEFPICRSPFSNGILGNEKLPIWLKAKLLFLIDLYSRGGELWVETDLANNRQGSNFTNSTHLILLMQLKLEKIRILCLQVVILTTYLWKVQLKRYRAMIFADTAPSLAPILA